MKTAAEREKEFRAALKALLKEHDAWMEITDDGRPYGLHSALVEIYMPAGRDEEDVVVEEETTFNL